MKDDAHSLLQAVAELARLTGETALKFFGRPLQVEAKSDGSPVTIADRTAEAAARDWITRYYPDDAVLGEELGELQPAARRRWLIDPIDGTKSFVRGVPLWGAMIAVAVNDELVAGAISCPSTGDLVAAATGCGCWHNGHRTQVSDISRLKDATVLATDECFDTHPDRRERWKQLAESAALARTWGDCYGYVLVATGRAEVMADDRLSPWDAAPLIPIIGEAGGMFTDWSGHRSVVGTDGLATNEALSTAVRRVLGVTN